MTMYRLSWEMPSAELSMQIAAKFITAADVPDEDWHKVVKETNDPWNQYHRLKGWSESGEEPIRNVKLEKAIQEVQWEEVKA